MLDHFRFLKKHCDTAHVTAKMTIPSPAVLHFRGGRKAISKEVYPDLEAFFEDLGKTYRKAVKAFYDAGCRYLQFDDTVWAYLCSQDELQKARERGDNPDGLQEIYARVINYAIAERPADMVDHHPCLPRQFPLHLDFVRRLRAGGGDHAGRHQLRRLFPRIRFRPRRRLRAAAVSAEGQQGRRGRRHHLEVRRAGEEGRHQAAAGRGGEVRAARAARGVAAMRLCLDRGGQHPVRGRAVGQAAARGRCREEVWGK